MDSKDQEYNVGEKPAYGSDESPIHDHRVGIAKEEAIAEATDIYGSAADAEHYGYVRRGLKSRHIQFIALGGTIGTGLFLGIGSAFTRAGPLSTLLGYTLTGAFIFMMMQCLGEMATWLPLPGSIPQFAARYVDDALGFAVGWNNWYASSITLCAEISAASVVIQYWEGAQNINVAAWISIIIVLIICLNIFAVSIYGEAEFVFASIKIITIIGLLMMAFIVDLGGNPHHDRLGFRYWKSPHSPMLEYDSTGNTGRFLGLFSVFVNAAFSYGGVELVAVAAGEAENPRKNIPKAVKRVFWRILFFYCLGTLAIGVLVAADDDQLLSALDEDAPGAAASPWVIGIQNAGIPALPSIINAVILTSATSSGNAFLYTGSRYLFALAQNGQAPRFLLKCSKAGVPVWCVLITASISGLTYLSVSSGGPATAFGWFNNLTTVASLFTWSSICVAYIKFHAALKAQGVDRNTLIFKSPMQPYLAWISLAFFVIIILFNGFDVFVGESHSHWDVSSFLAAYIGIPIFFTLYGFWKIFKRTKLQHPADADITSGKAALDAEVWPEQNPRNIVEKIWFWIA
ncbi:amino acid permease/ SLC12A domain-containing protein [Calycina marina]|uniref:Amino acid permease/ SLC12A domain-containing protein n=1 Tax=Calycina marina TaxID=1763456 RepID=A0A9P7Z216_9HELO|nr:amino acid permease/ SLC12A domain-containing protein [Calycina marina]